LELDTCIPQTPHSPCSYPRLGTLNSTTLNPEHPALHFKLHNPKPRTPCSLSQAGYFKLHNPKPRTPCSASQAGYSSVVIPLAAPANIGAKYLSYLLDRDICPTADLIFIDGNHDYDDVRADIANFFPLLSPE